MRITAIRHGETEGNKLRITQSHAPGVLTAKGIKQAEETAIFLSKQRFDVIYSSDLRRALDTAKIVAVYHPTARIVTAKHLGNGASVILTVELMRMYLEISLIPYYSRCAQKAVSHGMM